MDCVNWFMGIVLKGDVPTYTPLTCTWYEQRLYRVCTVYRLKCVVRRESTSWKNSGDKIVM